MENVNRRAPLNSGITKIGEMDFGDLVGDLANLAFEKPQDETYGFFGSRLHNGRDGQTKQPAKLGVDGEWMREKKVQCPKVLALEQRTQDEFEAITFQRILIGDAFGDRPADTRCGRKPRSLGFQNARRFQAAVFLIWDLGRYLFGFLFERPTLPERLLLLASPRERADQPIGRASPLKLARFFRVDQARDLEGFCVEFLLPPIQRLKENSARLSRFLGFRRVIRLIKDFLAQDCQVIGVAQAIG